MKQKGKFIEMVKKYPLLYDVTHEDYKNLYKRDKVWNEIGKEFDLPASELKKKWKSLRDIFARYIKKVNSETHPKRWIWASQMKFFLPYFFYTKAMLDNVNENYPSSDCDEYQSQDLHDVTESKEYIMSDDDCMVEDNNHSEESVSYEQESPVSPVMPVSYEQESPVSPVMPALTIKCESPPYNEAKPSFLKRNHDSEDDNDRNKKFKAVFDDMECLLLAHAKTIKKFSPKRQAITKYKIAQVILEQELLHVQEIPSDHPQASRKKYQSEYSEYSDEDNQHRQ